MADLLDHLTEEHRKAERLMKTLLDKMETIIKVNGKQTGHFHTNEMIFGIVPFIVELTKYFTLWPGDVIWMGTDGASPDIKAGDVVEIEVTGIGTLRNRFVAEQA